MDLSTEEIYKIARINNLKEMSEYLIEEYSYKVNFETDLHEIIKAINARIESIKKGDV